MRCPKTDNLAILAVLAVLSAGLAEGSPSPMPGVVGAGADTPLESLAPAFPLERLGSEHGLSHNGVHAIVQDRHGFLWFGTQDGLNRYDGREFRVYRRDPTDPTTLTSNFVTALLEDAGGRLWVGTVAGLQRLGARRGGFEHVPLRTSPRSSPGPRVEDLVEAADGRIWVATREGVFVVDPTRLAVDELSHDPDDPRSLAAPAVTALQIDSGGRIWALAGVAGGPTSLHRWDPPRGWQRFPLASHREAFVITGEDQVRFDSGPGVPLDAVASVSLAADPRPQRAVALLEDGADRLWIGTPRGLLVQEPGLPAPRRLGDTPAGEHRLTDEILDIFADRAGGVWVGTYGGILRYDPARKPFVHVDPTSGSGVLGDAAISAVVEGSDGFLWLGSFGGGLGLLDPDSGDLTRYRHRPDDPTSLCDNYIWSLDRGAADKLWIASSAGLCSHEKGGRFRHHPVVPEEGLPARSVVATDDDIMWVGSNAGVHRYDPATGTVRLLVETPEPKRNVEVIAPGPDGALWIGLDSPFGDVIRLEPDTGVVTRHQGVAEEGIWDLHPASGSRVWVASGSGLLQLHGDSGRVERLDTGELGSVYYSIAEDPRGRLWLGTNRGLVRHDPAAAPGERFRRYDLADGVGSVEFNRRAALVDRRGHMFFGGMDGLTAFDPLEIRDNRHVPPIVITDIQVLGDDGERRVDPSGLDRLVLSPDDYTAAFEFAALDFAAPAKNRYAYRLEGFDARWIEAGTRPFARYTSIPPGKYVLRVRGSNNDGVWNRKGTSLPLTVTPPFWRTPWFAVLALGGVAGTLTLAHSMRVARLREMERVRTRIADDLHDELGSDLSGIALTGAMLTREDYLRDEDRERITQVQESALEIMEGLRDIVWYIDPEHDSYEALEARMRAVADRLLPGVEHEFHSITPAGKAAVDMRIRPDLFLIYKELLHNVSRHAGASHVVIRFGVERGELILEIEDDGVGFDPEAVSKGTGLKSVRRRAEQLGAELTVASAPGAGTRVRLRGEL